MAKIYIVKSSEGEYEDYCVWNEKAFRKKEDAEEYARLLDQKHHFKPDFITDKFEELLWQCESKLPDEEEFSEYPITTENKERYFEWCEEQEKKKRQLLCDLMYQRGQFMTFEMYDAYIEWESNRSKQWYDCEIEELELI